MTPDVRSTSLDHDPVSMMYVPYWQRARPSGSLLVRTAMDPRGIAAALAIGRSVASLLFQVSPRDPMAFIAAGAALLLVSVAACLVPARRATRVNPTDALRFE